MLPPFAANAESQPERGTPDRKGGPHRPMADLWRVADSNQDGFISEDEFKTMPRVQNLPEEKRSNLFRRLDKNGDSKISREEIMHMGRPQDAKGQPPQRLWELDADRSGGISFEEFKSGRLFQKMPAERQSEVFRRLDTDGDGQITSRDKPQPPRMRDGAKPGDMRPGEGRERPPGFRPGGKPGPPQGGKPDYKRGPGKTDAEPRQLIRQFDTDGNGSLSFEEFRKSPAIADLGEDDQEERFNALDKNGDLKISPEDLPE